MMFPYGRPTHRLGPALDRNCGEGDAITFSRNAISQLVIVSEAIGESSESADFCELLFAGGHDCAESEIDGFEALRLKDLAPEVGINGDGFPLHGDSGWVGEEVKAVNEANWIFDF